MPKYEVSQSFNNNKARNYLTVDTDATTMASLVALMPKGQVVYEPSASGAQGTERIRPSSYVEAKVNCFDRTDAKVSGSFVTIKNGKSTLSGADIRTALVGKVEVPNGTSCDKVSLKSYRLIGA